MWSQPKNSGLTFFDLSIWLTSFELFLRRWIFISHLYGKFWSEYRIMNHAFLYFSRNSSIEFHKNVKSNVKNMTIEFYQNNAMIKKVSSSTDIHTFHNDRILVNKSWVVGILVLVSLNKTLLSYSHLALKNTFSHILGIEKVSCINVLLAKPASCIKSYSKEC